MPLDGKEPWVGLQNSFSALPKGRGQAKEQRQACECLVPNHPLLFLSVLHCVFHWEAHCSQSEHRGCDLLQRGSPDCATSRNRTTPARGFNGEFLHRSKLASRPPALYVGPKGHGEVK